MKLPKIKPIRDKEEDFGLILFRNKADWVILLAFILVGALLAFCISLFKEPVFEATASVTTNLHLAKDGSITEIMLDSQINLIGDLYYNPKVLDLLVEKEASQGVNLDLNWLRKNARIERKMLSSFIKVRHTDPVIAARIASEWAEILYDTLQSASPNAIEASIARNTLSLLENCANPQEYFEGDAFCKSMTKNEFDQAAQNAKEVLAEIGTKTLGLSEYLSVSQFQPAPVPDEPLSYHRGKMVLAGSAIGFFLAIGLFLIRKQNG